MKRIKNYLSLIKFSHTIFAMPFALIGLSLGWTAFNKWETPGEFVEAPLQEYINTKRGVQESAKPLYDIFYQNELILVCLLVILCMVFARSAAMAFNRYLDRNFDAKNPRTAIREIPAGVISANSVLWFTVFSCILFITCTFFINRICFLLSPVALAVVLGYSYTKRFTPFCHLILGLGLSLAPTGAYLAVTGQFSLLPVLFSFTVICWVSGFDIIYALQDEEFDKEHRLYSMPAWLGKKKALRLSIGLHVLSIAFVILAGLFGAFGWLYWAGVAVFAGMLIYQHSCVKPSDLRKVNIAFMTANGIASVVFALFVMADLFFSSMD